MHPSLGFPIYAADEMPETFLRHKFVGEHESMRKPIANFLYSVKGV